MAVDSLDARRAIWRSVENSLDTEFMIDARMAITSEEPVYGGLTEGDQVAIETSVPNVFPSLAEAIRRGVDQVDKSGESIFRDEAHAQNAYNLVRVTKQVTTATRMRDEWVAEVDARKSGDTTISQDERETLNAEVS